MYGAADGIVGSWTPDDPDGWTDEHLAALRQIETAMVVAVRMAGEREIARNIVTTYLGTQAGAQVLAGTIQRGDCRRIRAVIWFSDLRGSTPLAERLLPEEFMQILNAYFECTVDPVIEHGGEVLRFIGDAALAVFPVESQADLADACRRALGAARQAEARVQALNQQRRDDGEETLGYGIGLHEGEVSFGNIGIRTRLEFSVIGPAANEAARVESLTKTLEEPTLVTQAFARHLALDWRSVGRHSLRGVSGEVELFAPPAE
jgi:adenylate cyclase